MRSSPQAISRHTKAAILAACRRLMQAGRLRPSMIACCERAGFARRTGNKAFGPVAALHRQAIDDIATQHAILGRILRADRRALGLNAGRRMVRSAVLGRT
jgi:hypothetical protein